MAEFNQQLKETLERLEKVYGSEKMEEMVKDALKQILAKREIKLKKPLSNATSMEEIFAEKDELGLLNI